MSSNNETIFTPRQFAAFSARLDAETKMARRWRDENAYVISAPPKIGCELECCLTNEAFTPTPRAEEFIRAFADRSATYELGRFNVEFNLPPVSLHGAAFARMEATMNDHLRRASSAAASINARIFMCGILPTLTAADFVVEMITDRPRYQMLEQQLRIMNGGRPFAVNLGYGDGVQFAVNSAAIEAAATSFQAHLEIPEKESAALYNAAQVAGAAALAAGANAPYFMGRKLWAETRVPIFEQILYERFAGGGRRWRRRRDDIFGLRYVRRSAVELFIYNNAYMPPLLPLTEDSPPQQMRHLAFHNGTIWRWNRPIMGIADDGAPTLRIEHRPLPSGPTVVDMTANLAFFVGLTHGLHERFTPSQSKTTAARLPFAVVRDNFYAAARDGLDAVFVWLDGKKMNARDFILNEMLPVAADGLQFFSQLDAADGARMLDVIRTRVEKNQNGAQWQTRYIAKHGGGSEGMTRMAAAYWRHQENGRPVHEWEP